MKKYLKITVILLVVVFLIIFIFYENNVQKNIKAPSAKETKDKIINSVTYNCKDKKTFKPYFLVTKSNYKQRYNLYKIELSQSLPHRIQQRLFWIH